VSRLDSAIRRLEAQRAAIDHAAQLIKNVPGPVLELGLGNGRTFDHLRSQLPHRHIYAFDRQVAAHPDCIPAAPYLLLGDFSDTLKQARSVLPEPAALAHCDTGTGDEAASQALAAAIAPLLRPLLAPGAVVISDQPMMLTGSSPLPLPAGISAGRIFLWRIA